MSSDTRLIELAVKIADIAPNASATDISIALVKLKKLAKTVYKYYHAGHRDGVKLQEMRLFFTAKAEEIARGIGCAFVIERDETTDDYHFYLEVNGQKERLV